MSMSRRNAGVILNCLPPANILMPSLTLNILKTVLAAEDFFSEVKYWNLKFEPLFSDWSAHFGGENYEVSRLLPFIFCLAGKYNDSVAKERISGYLKKRIEGVPHISKQKSSRYLYAALPGKTESRIHSLIRKEIAETDFSNIILSGFTAKFYQWLPALLVAEATKSSHPDVKTIIGGFDSKSAAFEMLKNFGCFDFAVWGEGEYPLLGLSRMIEEGRSEFSGIPGLVFREKGRIIISEAKNRRYLDFNNYPETSYDDYFPLAEEIKKKGQVLCYPVEAKRGCTWNKCKFCVLNRGYKYRERKSDNIINEIKNAVVKYHAVSFQFMDNNLNGNVLSRLDEVLDKLAGMALESEFDFNLAAEVIPCGLDANFFRKLAIAGFRMVQLGGESFADSLISKMNKMNSFSDNLLAYKFCLKYGIQPIGANIITNIPGETLKDVHTCIDNIPFVRFFAGAGQIDFAESPLALDKLSVFYKEMNAMDREKYHDHFLYSCLPETMTAGMNRFELFHFCREKTPARKKLWEMFFSTLEKYKKTQITYKIYGHRNKIQYEEHCSGMKINSLLFDQSEQWEILKFCNDRLRSFAEIIDHLKSLHSGAPASEVKLMMMDLKSHYLLYFDRNYNKCISVIDTDLIL